MGLKKMNSKNSKIFYLKHFLLIWLKGLTRIILGEKASNALNKRKAAFLITFAFYQVYWFSLSSINLGGRGKIKWFSCLPAAADLALYKLISCSFISWKQLMLLLSGKNWRNKQQGWGKLCACSETSELQRCWRKSSPEDSGLCVLEKEQRM